MDKDYEQDAQQGQYRCQQCVNFEDSNLAYTKKLMIMSRMMR